LGDVRFVPEEQKEKQIERGNPANEARQAGGIKVTLFAFSVERMMGGKEHWKVFFLPYASGQPMGTNYNTFQNYSCSEHRRNGWNGSKFMDARKAILNDPYYRTNVLF
jgi:hypothetical protein